MKIFGREPALILGSIGVVVQLFSAFVLELSPDVQGALNAVAVGLVGVATAVAVSRDRLVPAVLGAAQAVLALLLAFGVDLAADKQTVIMAGVATVLALYTRTQVTASLPDPRALRPGYDS